MTTTDPTTPAEALRWYADHPSRADPPPWREQLRRWADELDAAAGVYQLPAEPPVGKIWEDSPGGGEWRRHHDGKWRAVDGPAVEECSGAHRWEEMLAYHCPLSTTPPAGTEPEVLCGCGAPILRPHRRGESGCEGAVVPPAGTEGEQ